jgi:Domain of unknown function (DUF4124)
MRKILLLLVFTAAAATAGMAQAQIKCWNQDGKRVCGDTPPPGAKVTTMRGAASGADPAPAPAAKDAKKGPLTPAEKEQDYRKRQAESQKAAEKQAAEGKAAEAKRYNCAQAREAVTTYESGQRVMRVRPDGERYFLDDAQIAQELAKSRQLVQENCN